METVYYLIGVIFVWFAAGVAVAKFMLWATLRIVADTELLSAVAKVLVEREKKRRKKRSSPMSYVIVAYLSAVFGYGFHKYYVCRRKS